MLQLLRFLAMALLRGGGGAGQLARIGAVAGGGGLVGGEISQRAFGPDGGGGPRRRRRRRVFNSMDRQDIAFIVATLGPTAGTKVAMIIAARG